MTRDQAHAALKAMAAGLAPDVAGVRRLLERISARDEAELLRDALTELGASAVLAGEAGR